MMKGLALADEASSRPRPGAAAALDEYAREQLSTRLKYVFGRIDTKRDGKIDAEELADMLVQLGCTPRKKKKGDRETVMCVRIDEPEHGIRATYLHGLTALHACREASPGVAAPEGMIWEVDEDGDGYVNWEEYMSAYERAVADKAGVEPRKLSTLIEFLLLDEEEHNWVWNCFLFAQRRRYCALLTYLHVIIVDAVDYGRRNR